MASLSGVHPLASFSNASSRTPHRRHTHGLDGKLKRIAKTMRSRAKCGNFSSLSSIYMEILNVLCCPYFLDSQGQDVQHASQPYYVVSRMAHLYHLSRGNGKDTLRKKVGHGLMGSTFCLEHNKLYMQLAIVFVLAYIIRQIIVSGEVFICSRP
ncbi:hypothetical protein Scep_001548 [Stephania cephalantha]|uniref:Uncharacterized protein n=1 Tax=Stephania cephalantha TaxID=152367 RepID=A0AAP0Q3G4_9MAGN